MSWFVGWKMHCYDWSMGVVWLTDWLTDEVVRRSHQMPRLKTCRYVESGRHIRGYERDTITSLPCLVVLNVWWWSRWLVSVIWSVTGDHVDKGSFIGRKKGRATQQYYGEKGMSLKMLDIVTIFRWDKWLQLVHQFGCVCNRSEGQLWVEFRSGISGYLRTVLDVEAVHK